MLTVAVTGGIGSGKTAASDAFARLGVPVIDTDILARELVEPGRPALERIHATFGPSVLHSDGTLDRAALGGIVFADASQRRRLEAILHPAIRSAVHERLATLDTPYAVIVIPLLVETGAYDWIDRVLVIDVPEAVQRERVRARDGLGDAEVQRIMASQVDRATRLAAADDVLPNTGSIEQLEDGVRQLHRQYLDLASQDAANTRGIP